MRVRFKDNLVTRLQGQAGGDDRVALGGVAREANLLGVGAEEARHGLARRLDVVVPGLGMFLQLGHHAEDGVEHRLRCRPEAARVQVDRIGQQRKLLADGAPERRGILGIEGRQRRRRGWRFCPGARCSRPGRHPRH